MWALAQIEAHRGPFWDEHREFVYLLVLATLFRLFAALLLTQGGHIYDGHPVYDYQFYRRLGELSLQGYYPSLHYWLEYPPLFSWTVLGIYRLSLLLPAMRDPIFWFHNFLGSFLALVDAGNLTLLYAIERRLAGRAVALRAAWMYALLFWPLYVMLGWLDSLPLLFLLAAVYGLVANRPLLVGAAAGLGFMTKLIPVVVAPLALRALARRSEQVIAALATVLVIALVAAPFLWLSPRLFLAGFQSALTRSSWETVWALFEGYFDVGVVAPLETHFDPGSAGWQNHAATLPWPLITGLFAVLYLLALSRVRRCAPRATVAFAGLAITLLLLFSKGYSSQFIVYLLPFVVLALPDGRGVAFAVLLSVANLLQFPLYPMLFRGEQWVTWTAVGLRTLLWLVLCAVFFVQAVGGAPAWLARWRDRAALPATITAALLVLGLAWPLLNAYVRGRGEYYDLGQYLRPLAVAGQGIVLSSGDLVGYLYPFLDGSPLYVLPENWEQQKDRTADALRAFSADHPQLWLVLDYSHGEDARQSFLEQTLDASGAKSTNRWFETFRLVGYVSPRAAERLAWRPIATTFGQTMHLEGYAAAEASEDGGPFRVLLRWRAAAALAADYSLFVHLVSAQGSIVAQRDKLLTRLGAGTAAWRAGDEAVDAADVFVPVGTPPGDYELRIGLYRPDDGRRLPLEAGGDALALARLRVARAAAQRLPRLPGAPVELGGGLRVLGYELGTKPRAGEPLPLALYLQAAGPLADYRLSVGLLRGATVVAMHEAVPGGAGYPPSKWQSGEVVRDLRQIAAAEAGRYAVGVKILGQDALPPPAGERRPAPDGWVILPGELIVER